MQTLDLVQDAHMFVRIKKKNFCHQNNFMMTLHSGLKEHIYSFTRDFARTSITVLYVSIVMHICIL